MKKIFNFIWKFPIAIVGIIFLIIGSIGAFFLVSGESILRKIGTI